MKALKRRIHGGRIVQSSGRKDRHSKVCTSMGPKDRRLRLSPKTAIQFYDVQDRLGYDRASKAIDWLIKESKAAIDALDADNHSITSNFAENQLNVGNPTLFQADPTEEDSLLYPINQQGFFSGFNTRSHIFDTNLEVILQKNFTSNENSGNAEYSVFNSVPQPVIGHNHLFSQREPLQSSFVNYQCNTLPISTELIQGINFTSDELFNFAAAAAAATSKEEEENNRAFW